MKELNVKEAFELWKQNEKSKDPNIKFYQFHFNSNSTTWQEDFNRPIWYFKKDTSKFSDNGFYIKNRDSYREDRSYLTSSKSIFISDDPNERIFSLNKKNILENINSFVEIKNNPYYYMLRDHNPDANGYNKLQDPMQHVRQVVKSLTVLISTLGLNFDHLIFENVLDDLTSFSNFYPHSKSENYNELYQHYFDLLVALYKDLEANKLY